MLCHELDNMPPQCDCTFCCINALNPEGEYKAICPYLGCFGLTDSQSFSEVGIHSIIGFPLSLGWLNPVGNDLSEEAKVENMNDSKVHVVIIRQLELLLVTISQSEMSNTSWFQLLK